MNNKIPLFIILILVVIIFSLPVFQAGFYFDDAGHSVLESRREMQGKSRLSFANETFDYMVSQQGRPAVIWSYLVLPLQTLIADNLSVYRSIHFTAGVVALCSVVLMLRQVVGGGQSTLFLVIFLTLIQFRNWHDGWLNYFLYVPLLLFSGSCTIIFWHRGLMHGRTLSTWLCAPLFYALGLLSCNEFMLIFLPVVCAMSISEPVSLKSKLFGALPLLLVSIIYILLNLWLKSRVTSAYWGVSPGPIEGIPKAYLIQLLSTFPLSCALFNPNGFMTNWLGAVSLAELCIALVGGIGAGTVMYLSLVNSLNFVQSNLLRLFSAGVPLLFLPPLLTAISLKYQLELRWGWGYLQVTLQVVGLALLVLGFISWLKYFFRKDIKRFTVMAFCGSCLTGFVFMGHSLFNQRLIDRLNEYDKTPRELCRALLEHYPLGVPSEKTARLLIDVPWLSSWQISEYFYRYSNQAFVISTWASYQNARATNPQEHDAPEELYYMSCPKKISEHDSGVIIFGKLSREWQGLDQDPRWKLSHIMLATRSLSDMHFCVSDSSGNLSKMLSQYRTIDSNKNRFSLFYHEAPISFRGSIMAASLVVPK